MKRRMSPRHGRFLPVFWLLVVLEVSTVLVVAAILGRGSVIVLISLVPRAVVVAV